jgi:cytochrome c553
MRSVFFTLLAASLFSFFLAAQQPANRASLGSNVSRSLPVELRGKALLVMPSGSLAAKPQHPLPENTTLVLLAGAANPPAYPEALRTLTASPADFRWLTGPEDATNPAPTLYLIDAEGFLRARRPVEPGRAEPAFEQARLLVEDYAIGKDHYLRMCGRCHGEDGRDTTYQNIAPIAGLGERMTLREIRTATETSGFVNLSGYPERHRNAIILYVAGL